MKRREEGAEKRHARTENFRRGRMSSFLFRPAALCAAGKSEGGPARAKLDLFRRVRLLARRSPRGDARRLAAKRASALACIIIRTTFHAIKCENLMRFE